MRGATWRGRWTDGLWAVPGFPRFWGAFAISEAGSQATMLAWPLLAAATLDASPRQMGLLLALMSLPHVLFTLHAGVWVDRRPRRPILVWTDFGRASLLATVPIAAWLGVLRIEHLYIIGLLVGSLIVLFSVAYQSYLPSLVQRERLVEANSHMVLTSSVAQIGGPAVAGPVIAILGAPLAIAFDACSFVVSGLLVRSIRDDVAPPAPVVRRSWRGDIAEGLRLVWHNSRLRAIALASAAMSVCGGMADAAFVLFAIDEIGIGVGALGFVFAAGGVGFMAGAWLTRRWAAPRPPARVIVIGAVLMTAGQALLPFAPPATLAATAVFAASFFVVSVSSALYSVNQLSLRQRIAPDHLLGRVNATMRFVTLGPTPLGALLGGVLGSVIGLRPTLVVATLVLALSIPAARGVRE